MNKFFTVAAAVLAGGALFSSSVVAESLPLKSVNKANEVIAAAIEAHGGQEALENLSSVVQKSTLVTWQTGQSRKPGPPYDKGKGSNLQAIDLESSIYFSHNTGEGGGYVFDQGVIIDGEDSWQLNHRAGTAAPIAEPDFDTQSGPFIRVTPPLLMKQLQARAGQSNWLGEVEIDGKPHDVVTLVMAVGPVLSLYIDRESHMLTRMERVLPPFGQVEYRFTDYQEVDGIPFNQSFMLYVNGDENLDIDILATKVNVPVSDYAQLPDKLKRVAAVTPDDMSINEVAENVYLAGGNGTYTLFAVQPESVVAIGGTLIVPEAIKLLREQVTDLPISHGVLTHHHSDHVPGAATYAKQGATLVTFAENESVVRQAAGNEIVKLSFFEGEMSLGSGPARVELYNIGPTPHAENILIAWLPEQKLIFEADHFPQPANGVIPPAVPATVAFAAALDRLGLDYEMITGTHSPRTAGPEDMKTALARGSAVAASK